MADAETRIVADAEYTWVYMLVSGGTLDEFLERINAQGAVGFRCMTAPRFDEDWGWSVWMEDKIVEAL